MQLHQPAHYCMLPIRVTSYFDATVQYCYSRTSASPSRSRLWRSCGVLASRCLFVDRTFCPRLFAACIMFHKINVCLKVSGTHLLFVHFAVGCEFCHHPLREKTLHVPADGGIGIAAGCRRGSRRILMQKPKHNVLECSVNCGLCFFFDFKTATAAKSWR